MKKLLAFFLPALLASQIIMIVKKPASGSSPAWVQDDGSTFDPFTTARAVTFSSTTTSGNMVLAAYSGANTISSCSDNFGNTYAVLGTSNVQTCAAYNITGGSSHAVTVTLNASNSNPGSILIVEYSGIATSAAFDQTCENASFIANISCTTGTTTTASQLVVGIGSMGGATPTAGATYTLRISQGGIHLEDKVVSATGTQVVNLTHSERTAGISGLTFKGQ